MRKWLILFTFTLMFLLSACNLIPRNQNDLETLIGKMAQDGNYTMNFLIQTEHINFGTSYKVIQNDVLVQTDFELNMTLYLTGLRNAIYEDYDRDLSNKVRNFIPIITSSILMNPSWLHDMFEMPLDGHEPLTQDCWIEENAIYHLDASCLERFGEAYVLVLYHEIKDLLFVIHDGRDQLKTEIYEDILLFNRYLTAVSIQVYQNTFRMEMQFNVNDYLITSVFNLFDLNLTEIAQDERLVSWIDAYYLMLFNNGVYEKIQSHIQNIHVAAINYCAVNPCIEGLILTPTLLNNYINKPLLGDYLVEVVDADAGFLIAYEHFNIRYVGPIDAINTQHIIYKNHPFYSQLAFNITDSSLPTIPQFD